MAWVSTKVYAILNNSEEGKDIIERLPDMTQDECQQELDAFFGEGGAGASSSNEYGQAKADDEAEENAYKAVSEEDASDDDLEEDENEDYGGYDNPDSPDKSVFDKNYQQALETNNYEKAKEIYDRQVQDRGENAPETMGTKKALDEMSKNFDQGNNNEDEEEKQEEPKEEMPKSSYYLSKDKVIAGDEEFSSHADINRKEGKDLYAEDKAIAINPGVYGSHVMKIDVPQGEDLTDYEYSHLVKAIDLAQKQGKTIDLGKGYTFESHIPASDILEAIISKRRGR